MSEKEGWKVVSGWWVEPIDLLREEPKKKSDLVVFIQPHESTGMEGGLFDTEAEGWAEAKKWLTEKREQALRDLESLSEPRTTPRGEEGFCSPEKIEEWKQEAAKELRIADAGLKLCP